MPMQIHLHGHRHTAIDTNIIKAMNMMMIRTKKMAIRTVNVRYTPCHMALIAEPAIVKNWGVC